MKRSLYRGDCLSVLEEYVEPESVDLVYLDPPFNSKSTYNLPFKGKRRQVINLATPNFVFMKL